MPLNPETQEYDIFYIYADGCKACVSWPKFKSALDAAKSLAMLASWGLPKGRCSGGCSRNSKP